MKTVQECVEQLKQKKEFIEIYAQPQELEIAAEIIKELQKENKQFSLTTQPTKDKVYVTLQDIQAPVSQEETQQIADIFEIKALALHKALTYTTQPYISGISGNEEAAISLCKKLQIPLKEQTKLRSYLDLTHSERIQLLQEIEKITGKEITKTTTEINDQKARIKTALENDQPGLAISMLLGNNRSKIQIDHLFQKDQKEIIEVLKNYKNYVQHQNDKVTILTTEHKKARHIKKLLQFLEGKKTVIIANTTLDAKTIISYKGEKSIVEQLLANIDITQKEDTYILSQEQEKTFQKNCTEKLQNLIIEEKMS